MRARLLASVLLLAAGPMRADDEADLAPLRIEGIDVRQSIAYYPLRAHTPQGLFAEMERTAPSTDAGGRPGFGHAQADLRWRYDLAMQDDATCVPEEVEVTLEVTLTLPRWTPGRSPSKGLRARWQAYRDALVAHERHHRDLAIEAVRELRDALRTLPPTPCAAAPLRIEATTTRIVERMRRRNATFDAASDHGRRHWHLP